MAEYHIQFRDTDQAARVIGEVNNVRDRQPGIPGNVLGHITVTGVSDTLTLNDLRALISAQYTDPDADTAERVKHKVCVFDYDSLPEPYLSDIQANRYTSAPFSTVVPLLYNHALGRNLTMDDFQ